MSRCVESRALRALSLLAVWRSGRRDHRSARARETRSSLYELCDGVIQATAPVRKWSVDEQYACPNPASSGRGGVSFAY